MEQKNNTAALGARLMQKNERLSRFIRKEIERLAERESDLTLGDVEESLLRVRWETEEALTEAFFGKENCR